MARAHLVQACLVSVLDFHNLLLVRSLQPRLLILHVIHRPRNSRQRNGHASRNAPNPALNPEMEQSLKVHNGLSSWCIQRASACATHST